MAVENHNPDSNSKPALRSGTRFPTSDLATCAEVPRLIHVKGGGQLTPDQLASHLGYKGTNNGAYLSKVAAARYFGLIDKVGPIFIPTTLAHQILSPVYPHDAKKAFVDAFMCVELFKRVYESFRGRELPPEFGMLNALGNQFGVAPDRVKDAYRTLMDSADTAGFFATKAGARTHLIMPLVQPVPQVRDMQSGQLADPALSNGGGGGHDAGNANSPGTVIPGRPVGLNEVKAKYLSTLIALFETKAQKGELDKELMERIERLLGESKA